MPLKIFGLGHRLMPILLQPWVIDDEIIKYAQHANPDKDRNVSQYIHGHQPLYADQALQQIITQACKYRVTLQNQTSGLH